MRPPVSDALRRISGWQPEAEPVTPRVTPTLALGRFQSLSQQAQRLVWVPRQQLPPLVVQQRALRRQALLQPARQLLVAPRARLPQGWLSQRERVIRFESQVRHWHPPVEVD